MMPESRLPKIKLQLQEHFHLLFLPPKPDFLHFLLMLLLNSQDYYLYQGRFQLNWYFSPDLRLQKVRIQGFLS